MTSCGFVCVATVLIITSALDLLLLGYEMQHDVLYLVMQRRANTWSHCVHKPLQPTDNQN